MTHPEVQSLLEACPFLKSFVQEGDLDLPTVVFGAVAQLLMSGRLPAADENATFAYFNELAERADSEGLEILGTGAIEMFNDNAAAQQLARSKLQGKALAMLEDFRAHWGQPDYGNVAND